VIEERLELALEERHVRQVSGLGRRLQVLSQVQIADDQEIV
jgi:hypothetical protein